MMALPMRVFARRAGTMTSLPPVMPLVGPNGVCIGVASAIPPQIPPGASADLVIVLPQNYVIMYATGCADQQQQPIYEGDIVEGDFEGVTDDDGTREDYAVLSFIRRRGVIVWQAEVMGFQIRLAPIDGSKEAKPEYNDWEVRSLLRIGNIWQHRHLIEPPKEPASAATVEPPKSNGQDQK